MLNTLLRTRVLSLMRANGLSQAALSRAARVRQQDVSRFLTDDMVNPSLDFLDRLARVFQFTLADLLAKDLPQASLTADEQALLSRYRATSSELKRQAVIAFLQTPAPAVRAKRRRTKR